MGKIIINQPAMLGDILFVEPIVRKYLQEDKEVIWPVKDQYYWIKDYIIHHGLKIVRQSEYGLDHEYFGFKKIGDDDYIPLRFSTPLFRGEENPHSGNYHEHFMLDKYRLLGLPLDMWKSMSWIRNYQKEDDLYRSLGLSENSRYNLVNYFMKDIYERQEEMANMNFEGNNIYMKPMEGYTLLDWTKVIINAEKIFTVETALIYMVEVLPIKASEINMFSRTPYQDTVGGVKNFISNKWVLHEK